MENNNSPKQTFNWPILGQSQIVKFLQSCISREYLSHAYLFNGPKNAGKFICATYFATSILCQNKNVSEPKPCYKCPSCQQFKINLHPDLYILAKEDDKKNISIEQIRNIQHKLTLKSFLKNYKIAIIDEADLMSEEAANGLLKTLEEPPPQTILILVSTNKDLLPQTIISRCQVVQFNIISTEHIENWLISQGKSKRDSKIIAQYSNGRIGLAEKVLSDPKILDQRYEQIKKLVQIINSNVNEKFHIVNSLIPKTTTDDTNKKVNKILDDWLSFYRDMILAQNSRTYISNIKQRIYIDKYAKSFNITRILNSIKKIQYSKKLLLQSINPKLILENLVLYI